MRHGHELFLSPSWCRPGRACDSSRAEPELSPTAESKLKAQLLAHIIGAQHGCVLCRRRCGGTWTGPAGRRPGTWWLRCWRAAPARTSPRAACRRRWPCASWCCRCAAGQHDLASVPRNAEVVRLVAAMDLNQHDRRLLSSCREGWAAGDAAMPDLYGALATRWHGSPRACCCGPRHMHARL